jgi:hypothetical protein
MMVFTKRTGSHLEANIGTLTPVSKKIGYCFIAVFFINLGCFA